MTHAALVMIAPVFTLERFNDPAWRSDRTMYESLQFLPGKDTIPLIVNHDDSRQIGTCAELFRMDWIDGGPWICARATVDTPPEWLQRGTRASFGFTTLRRRELSLDGVEAQIVTRALVQEVSVLSPGKEPVEPCASVWAYRPTETTDRAVVGDTLLAPQRIVRRGIGQVLAVDGVPVS